ASLPAAIERQIAARRRGRVEELSVEAHGRRPVKPCRDAETNRQRGSRRRGHGEDCARRHREAGLLTERKAFFLPVEFGGDEEVDVYAIGIAPVDAVVELGILLDAGAGAAPERLVLGGERLPDPGSKAEIVLRGSDLRADGPDAMVEKKA